MTWHLSELLFSSLIEFSVDHTNKKVNTNVLGSANHGKLILASNAIRAELHKACW